MGSRQKRRIAATRSRFFAKMRPPRVFWDNFGSRKRYARSYARDFKMAFGPPTRLQVVAWVPFTYSLHARYLASHQPNLNGPWCAPSMTCCAEMCIDDAWYAQRCNFLPRGHPTSLATPCFEASTTKRTPSAEIRPSP